MELGDPTAPELLDRGFMRHALIACLAVGVAAPTVGTFVVQRRQSLIGDGIGHVAFAGVGMAFLFDFPVLAGAAALSVLAAVVLPWLQRTGLTGDLSLATILYGGIALGYFFPHRSGVGVNNALGILFGSPPRCRGRPGSVRSARPSGWCTLTVRTRRAARRSC